MYPISVKLDGRRVVVVGGGKVAERRVVGLRDQNAEILVIAPDATPSLQSLANAGVITWRKEKYRNELLDSAFLVVAATNDASVNAAVTQDAQVRNLLVCRADEFDDGNFTTPAVVQRGDLVLTVTTGGKSPTLTALLRERLGSEFGPEWEGLTAILGGLRERIKMVGDETARRQAVQRILDDEAMQELIRHGSTDEAEARAVCLLSSSE